MNLLKPLDADPHRAQTEGAGSRKPTGVRSHNKVLGPPSVGKTLPDLSGIVG
jgi:hypothetical protein